MKHSLIISIFILLNLEASTTIVSTTKKPVNNNLSTMTSSNDKELSWVDEQIRAILPARVGVSDSYINGLSDPVKYDKPISKIQVGSKLLAPPRLGGLLTAPVIIPKVVEEPLRLMAIFNKSVLVNGKWYRLNDSIRNYTLSEIKANSILLTGSKDQKLILFLSKQNNNIKINTK